MISDHRRAVSPGAIFDGESRLLGHSVILDGEHIAAVVPASDVPDGIHNAEHSAAVLLPGLIDCHVHLSDWMMPGFLGAGVTTVRDTGNDLQWILERRSANEADPTNGPRILCCGPLLDGPTAIWPPIGRSHRTPGEMAASIGALAAAGVDAVKLYANLDLPLITAAVTAAAEVGVPLLAHLGDVDAVDAVDAGVREIQHMSGCISHLSGASPAGVPAEQVAVWAAAFARTDTTVCPTVVVWDRLSRVTDAVFRHDARSEWVHPVIRDAWLNFPHRSTGPRERMDRQSSVTAMKRVLPALSAAGVRIIAGSDTPWPNIAPGFGLHDELALMVDGGLTTHEALVSATSAAADALGIGGSVGRIRPGLEADLLLVDGDPLDDITDLSNVVSVTRRGRDIDLSALRNSLAARFAIPPTDAVAELILAQPVTQ